MADAEPNLSSDPPPDPPTSPVSEASTATSAETVDAASSAMLPATLFTATDSTPKSEIFTVKVGKDDVLTFEIEVERLKTSPVLYAMATRPFREKDDRLLQLPDDDPEDFRLVLEYLTNPDKNPVPLSPGDDKSDYTETIEWYLLANKYLLPVLQGHILDRWLEPFHRYLWAENMFKFFTELYTHLSVEDVSRRRFRRVYNAYFDEERLWEDLDMPHRVSIAKELITSDGYFAKTMKLWLKKTRSQFARSIVEEEDMISKIERDMSENEEDFTELQDDIAFLEGKIEELEEKDREQAEKHEIWEEECEAQEERREAAIKSGAYYEDDYEEEEIPDEPLEDYKGQIEELEAKLALLEESTVDGPLYHRRDKEELYIATGRRDNAQAFLDAYDSQIA